MAGKKKPKRGGKARPPAARAAAPAAGPGFWADEKCRRCPALCCRYIALVLDTPRHPEDYDNLRWYLDHKRVSVFVQDGRWHLCVDTPCRHLVHNRCRIHGSKPELCQRHDPSQCEFDNPDFRLDHEFRAWEDLDRYLQEKQREKSEAGTAK
jgi:Fe-S-cluster containining protein